MSSPLSNQTLAQINLWTTKDMHEKRDYVHPAIDPRWSKQPTERAL
jgi:hypothetical protein